MRDLLLKKAAWCAFLPDQEHPWENMEASLVCESEVYWYICMRVDTLVIVRSHDDPKVQMLLSLNESVSLPAAGEHHLKADAQV